MCFLVSVWICLRRYVRIYTYVFVSDHLIRSTIFPDIENRALKNCDDNYSKWCHSSLFFLSLVFLLEIVIVISISFSFSCLSGKENFLDFGWYGWFARKVGKTVPRMLKNVGKIRCARTENTMTLFSWWNYLIQNSKFT